MSDRETENSQELWGGRFSEPTDAFVQRFTASEAFDRQLAVYDIAGSRAHAEMLMSTGVLTADENAAIQQGLTDVLAEIEQGSFEWSVAREDVHMNIEARLTELIGDVGKKLHTGRSRNDQVATDLRLYLRAALDAISAELTRLMIEEMAKDDNELPHKSLSDREYEVLFYIGEGKTMTEIANQLSLSIKTVSTYRSRILEKMRLKSNSDLVKYILLHDLSPGGADPMHSSS